MLILLLCWAAGLVGFLVGCWWGGRKVANLMAINHRLATTIIELQAQAEQLRDNVIFWRAVREQFTNDRNAIDDLIRDCGGRP